MKKRLLMFLVVLSGTVFLGTTFAANIPVTFQVDMRIKTAETLFVPGTDNVTVRGSFMSELGMSGDWFPDEGALVLADADADTIYTLTIDMPDASEGTAFEHKFAINDAQWEVANNVWTLTGPTQVLPVVLFDDDDVVNIQSTNTLNFTADLTSLYGTGAGFFDPSQDTLYLQGLDWEGAIVTGGDREFVEDAFNPGIFHSTMEIKGVEADSTKWKTKVEPAERWFNTGWEVTRDKWHHIQADGAEVDVPTFVPDIFPMKPALSTAVEVRFQVNMTNAINRDNGETIDPATLIFVGLKGQNEVLGAWAGDWELSDTTAGNLLVLNDGGENGDLVADDDVWSLLVTFPVGNDGGPSLYKYCAYYPGVETVNQGIQYLDHEMPPATDHWLVISEGPTIELDDDFGVYQPFILGIEEIKDVIPVRFELSQNYPNPFNPTTTIRFSIPVSGLVATLKVYNLLGREVARLVDKEVNPGVYEITFDASAMASGVYFLTLTAGDYRATRKMMILK